MSTAPVIPPRPSRSQEKPKDAPPSIPPRPVDRRINRSVSPNPDRFAPSPFSDGPISAKAQAAAGYLPGASHLGSQLSRAPSVDLPGPGEEGQEYAAAIEAAAIDDITNESGTSGQSSSSPEQTRTVGEDIKLHAPKPTMPAQSATTRVATVTRTDSDRAASFGIGRPRSTEQNMPSHSLRKKASTASQLSQSSHADEELGIPHIGQHVPMYPNAGDVQAPSPAPGAMSDDPTRPRNHTRKRSSRGFNDLPPGSYGLHGHGVAANDKLERAYFEKHPELLHKEHLNYQHDRPTDFSRSSDELNKIVHETARRSSGLGSSGYMGTPSEQVGFQAAEEYTSRRRSSATPRDSQAQSVTDGTSPGPQVSVEDTDITEDGDVIHVNDRRRRQGYADFGDEESAIGEGPQDQYHQPILASDEVAKGSSPYDLYAAVEPPPERSGSAFEMDEPRSRPTSRPASVYSQPPPEIRSTPLDDVEEYEPLFPENETKGGKALSPEQLKEIRKRFPSRDIWEDAPNSVHATAEVSTPDLIASSDKPKGFLSDVPQRSGETPAQAFARRQEELAEQEGRTPDGFLWRRQKAPVIHRREEYADQDGYKPQGHLWQSGKSSPGKDFQSAGLTEQTGRPNHAPRFPSRDVWEDTPDSLRFTTTVSRPQSVDGEVISEEESPSTKPAVPMQPRKQGSEDDVTSKPTIPDRPKPKVPNRPTKQATEAKESEAASKAKPAIPPRPAGSKIAALQAGFMSDLNKRLQLGPSAPKKEEPSSSDLADLTEQKEKAPLADARKGRARGPQRKAPTKTSSANNASSGPPPASRGQPVLSFSMTQTLWSIDEEGIMTVEDPEISAEPSVSKSETAAAPAVQETAESPVPEVDGKADSTVAHQEMRTTDKEPAEKDEGDKDEVKTEETKTLVTNTAGESILEETIEKKPGDQVEAVQATKDEVVE